MSYYTDKISEVPKKIMKEIAGIECRNAKNYLDVGVLAAVCEAFIVPYH